MERKDFTFTTNARGYMIQYKGQNIGGAGISNDAPNPRGHHVRINLKYNGLSAEATIRAILHGMASTYMAETIQRIDKEEDSP